MGFSIEVLVLKWVSIGCGREREGCQYGQSVCFCLFLSLSSVYLLLLSTTRSWQFSRYLVYRDQSSHRHLRPRGYAEMWEFRDIQLSLINHSHTNTHIHSPLLIFHPVSSYIAVSALHHLISSHLTLHQM
jgi:hypothetical protein